MAQIVQYEAEQNVPFPMDEVVWDYQLLGDTPEETNVILVAVKIENITSLTDCAVAAGMEPEIVDVAPMALYNAVRYNYPDLTGCTMVLDIGARSSNLIFIQEGRIFSRSIPVAGNSMTQEIAKEFGVPFADAERMKIENAFVALGGVYAGADNDTADRVSKIVRNVVTRLHAEVNRSINFYRSQQRGSVPTLVLLAGGSSVIPHMDTFFREKLKAEVEYLNPLANVTVSPALSQEQLEVDFPLLGEVIGLGLRRALTCPVEINLMPPSLVEKKAIRRRQPFFALSAVGMSLIMLCWWVYTERMTAMFRVRAENVEKRIGALKAVSGRLNEAVKGKKVSVDEVGTITRAINARSRWLGVFDSLHECLLNGMWLTSIKPEKKDGEVVAVIIEGRGFVDSLKKVESGAGTAISVFCEKLRSSDSFGDGTKIRHEPAVAEGASVREFIIRVVLQESIAAR